MFSMGRATAKQEDLPAGLAYATGAMPSAKPALSPAEIRRRRLIVSSSGGLGLVLLLLLAFLYYVLYAGDNRWRVRFHHAVNTPPSARDFRCAGATALTYWLGNHSSARFVINPGDLPRFLSQFQQGVSVRDPSGGVYITGKPFAGPITPDGELSGPSPTGTDYYQLKWHTASDGVHVELQTDWN
jgi:hypothetical protein